MNMKKKILVFSAAFIIVLAIPLYFIMKNESLLASGKEDIYKFHLRPCEPHDFMRGKYITLIYNRNEIQPHDTSYDFKQNDVVYVTVERDEEGYAHFKEAYCEVPQGKNYFVTRVGKVNTGRRRLGGTIGIIIPFDRYYVNEDYAQQAEDVYREKATQSMYAEVVIKNGDHVLKEVYVNDIPLPEYLRETREEYEALKAKKQASR